MPQNCEMKIKEIRTEYGNTEVRKCGFDDIAEIDTFSELKKLDATYCV
jgi:hypothetical protein